MLSLYPQTMKKKLPLAACAGVLSVLLCGAVLDGGLGIFTDHGDVGIVSQPGTAVYDAAKDTYTVGGSGANMWAKADAMQYLWRKKSGDFSIAADIAFVSPSSQPHRKACLVVRQNLDPGSPYVDVAQHGSGLTSLQFRDTQDGMTREIEAMTDGPTRVRLDRIGDDFYLSVGYNGAEPNPSGASYHLALKDPVYVGLAVCAHDDAAFETAVFSDVKIGSASRDAAAPQPGLHVITLPSGDQRVTDH
jgi:TolB protein